MLPKVWSPRQHHQHQYGLENANAQAPPQTHWLGTRGGRARHSAIYKPPGARWSLRAKTEWMGHIWCAFGNDSTLREFSFLSPVPWSLLGEVPDRPISYLKLSLLLCGIFPMRKILKCLLKNVLTDFYHTQSADQEDLHDHFLFHVLHGKISTFSPERMSLETSWSVSRTQPGLGSKANQEKYN